jgi:hypothetical protein
MPLFLDLEFLKALERYIKHPGFPGAMFDSDGHELPMNDPAVIAALRSGGRQNGVPERLEPYLKRLEQSQLQLMVEGDIELASHTGLELYATKGAIIGVYGLSDALALAYAGPDRVVLQLPGEGVEATTFIIHYKPQ